MLGRGEDEMCVNLTDERSEEGHPMNCEDLTEGRSPEGHQLADESSQ